MSEGASRNVKMICSITTSYAIRAVRVLASVYPKSRSVAEIAYAEKIPAEYLKKIFAEMSQESLVIGQRGKGGGYRLCRDPDKITFREIVQIFEPELHFSECIIGLCKPAKIEQCPLRAECLTLSDSIYEFCESANFGCFMSINSKLGN